MTGNGTRFLRGLLIGSAVLTYYLVAHRVSAAESAGVASILFAWLPFAVLVLVLAGRSGQRGRALLLLSALALGLALAWPHLQARPSVMYFLQHLGGNLLLAFVFGRSLFKGRQPLVTYFASFIHRPSMPPLIARYTRQVTIAWTGFFLAMATVSSFLFALASAETWSIFANLLSLPLVISMFLGEYLVRCVVVPAHERTSIRDSLRAYREALAEAQTSTEPKP
jgi:uncharacterized membrane protein